MNPVRLVITAGLLAAFTLLLSSPAIVDACGYASRRNMRVAIADESAIIIWDEMTKTQHFIRRATFKTDAEDFGFLVPTPTRPELGEAKDKAFSRLARFAAPKLSGKKGGGKGGGGGKEPPAVEVLEEKRVANQDLAVLKANDADALGKWLKDHGYEFSPALKNWVKPYIDAQWIITASKIAKDREGLNVKNVSSAAVRMTFKTEHPFYPYRELAEEGYKKDGQQKRLLRVFFLSKLKMQGTIGVKGELWPGKVVGTGNISLNLRKSLLEDLKLSGDSVPESLFVTVFEDYSVARPGADDVYFRAD